MGSARSTDHVEDDHHSARPHPDGISLSESDAVAVLDFEAGEELAYLPVGDHPQRLRHGFVPEAVVASWSPPTEPEGTDATKSGGLIPTVSVTLGSALLLLNPLLPLR